MDIEIKVGSRCIKAAIFNTRTGKKIGEILPFNGVVNTWGDEIYFEIPIEEELDETAKELVELGDIGYWPSGNSFCIFYGRTPISKKDEIRPASAVNIIGKILGDPSVFKGICDGEQILLTQIKEK
jgi:uncharacterized protein